MPKPIKKRVAKKARVEEEAKDYLEHARSYYGAHRKQIQIGLVAVLAVLLIAVGGVYYVRNTTARADEVSFEAYKSYSLAVSRNDNTLLRDALDKYTKVYGIKKSPQVLFYEGDIYQRLGDMGKAIAALNTLIKEFPGDVYLVPLAYGKLGMIHLTEKDYEKALASFQGIEKSTFPVYKDFALYQESRIYKKMGKEEDAKKVLENLTKLFPESPYAKNAMAEMKAETASEGKKTEEKTK
jgi:tetratricopeptide (TPR) repeat protein